MGHLEKEEEPKANYAIQSMQKWINELFYVFLVVSLLGLIMMIVFYHAHKTKWSNFEKFKNSF